LRPRVFVANEEFEEVRCHRVNLDITRKLIHSKELEYDEKRRLAQAATGKHTAAATLRKMGKEGSTLCPLCGESQDTLYHRAWE
jgi:hypothetical protein